MREVKHPNEMNEEELRELVWQMSGLALDLAQHLDWTTNALKVQYRKHAYDRSIQMAREICYAWEFDKAEGNVEIALFDNNGLTVTRDNGECLTGEGNLPLVDNDLKEIDYNDFEQLFMQLELLLLSDEDLLRLEQSLQSIQDLADGKRGKESVEIKVRALRKSLLKMEYIKDLAKVSKMMYNIIRGELKDKK